jgi:hypothetical protein
MSFLGFAILLAAVATEEKWMWRRVLFQAVTLALVVVAYLLQHME